MEASNTGQEAGQFARRLFEEGWNCAESVFQAVCLSWELPRADIQRLTPLATAFGMGCGRTGNMCGALSGGVLAMNHAYGRTAPDQDNAYCLTLAQEFIERFKAEQGAVCCPDLLGCDLSTPEGRKYFQDNNLMARCHGFAEHAANLAVEVCRLNGRAG